LRETDERECLEVKVSMKNVGNMHYVEFRNLIGVDGVTERTGEISRPTDVCFANAPNLSDSSMTAGIIMHDNASKARQEKN
jgi:hypothetical protein